MKIRLLDTVETPMTWFDDSVDEIKTQVLVLKKGQEVDLSPHPGWKKTADRLVNLRFAEPVQ